MRRKPKPVAEYYYWSERIVSDIADDNGIYLRRSPINASISIGKVQIGRGNLRETLFRDEIRAKIRRAIGDAAESDFATPDRVHFATGVGRIDMGQFIAAGDRRDTAYMYTVVQAGNGDRVAICLFGSMHNYSSRIRDAEPLRAGWTSSSGPYILRLMNSHGASNGYSNDPDDFEYVAVEAVKAVLHQGMPGYDYLYDRYPEARGFTLGHAHEVEWFAKIYSDITVTKSAWNDSLADLGSPDRILIGAPIWARSAESEKLRIYTREIREVGFHEIEQLRQRANVEGTTARSHVSPPPVPHLRVRRDTEAPGYPSHPSTPPTGTP